MSSNSLIEKIKIIARDDNKEVLFLDPMYNDCLIGFLTDGSPTYSFKKIISTLMNDDQSTYTEALEFFDFNVLGILHQKEGFSMPVVVYDDEV